MQVDVSLFVLAAAVNTVILASTLKRARGNPPLLWLSVSLVFVIAWNVTIMGIRLWPLEAGSPSPLISLMFLIALYTFASFLVLSMEFIGTRALTKLFVLALPLPFMVSALLLRPDACYVNGVGWIVCTASLPRSFLYSGVMVLLIFITLSLALLAYLYTSMTDERLKSRLRWFIFGLLVYYIAVPTYFLHELGSIIALLHVLGGMVIHFAFNIKKGSWGHEDHEKL